MKFDENLSPKLVRLLADLFLIQYMSVRLV